VSLTTESRSTVCCWSPSSRASMLSIWDSVLQHVQDEQGTALVSSTVSRISPRCRSVELGLLLCAGLDIWPDSWDFFCFLFCCELLTPIHNFWSCSMLTLTALKVYQ
jgi:hypothetical protein